jgi:hypothetical protein
MKDTDRKASDCNTYTHTHTHTHTHIHTHTYTHTHTHTPTPCRFAGNDSGFLDPEVAAKWGLVDFDWSNAKGAWTRAKPMDCEERLVTQARMVKSVSPKTRVWVYRNLVKALPWYSSVVRLPHPLRFVSALCIPCQSPAVVQQCCTSATSASFCFCTLQTLSKPCRGTAVLYVCHIRFVLFLHFASVR